MIWDCAGDRGKRAWVQVVDTFVLDLEAEASAIEERLLKGFHSPFTDIQSVELKLIVLDQPDLNHLAFYVHQAKEVR